MPQPATIPGVPSLAPKPAPVIPAPQTDPAPVVPPKPSVPSPEDIRDALENRDNLNLSPAQRLERRMAAQAEAERVKQLNLKIDPKYQAKLDAEKARSVADQAASFASKDGKFGSTMASAAPADRNVKAAAVPSNFAPAQAAAVGAPLEGEKPMSRAAAMIKKATESGPTVKKEPTDTEKAIKNGFDSGKIFDLVGGLGASLESAYGNRALADTLYGKKWGAEDAAAQELERLSKAQGFTSEEAAKQRAFEGQQNAAQREVQLQASGAMQDKDRQGQIAKTLLATMQQGGALTPEQKKFLSGYYGTNAGIFGSSLGGGSTDPLGVRK